MDDWRQSGLRAQSMGYISEEEEEHQQALRRLRSAQIAALQTAKVQLVAKKRFDAEVAARVQDLPVWREPPSPAAASTASAALEDGSEGSEAEDWSQSNNSTSSAWSLTNSEASQMKAKIHEVMARLQRAREEIHAHRNDCESRAEVMEPATSPALPPREGEAWEAARLEVARALAEGQTDKPPDIPTTLPSDAYGVGRAASAASTLSTERCEAHEEYRFDKMVRLQLAAQEAMRRRVEESKGAARAVSTRGCPS